MDQEFVKSIIPLIPILREAGEPARLKREEEAAHALTVGKCVCGYDVPLTNFKPYWTGRVNALDNVCKGCVPQFLKMAKIICKNCKLPVLHVSPHSDNAGFKFEAGKVYHVNACPTCSPETSSVVPDEKLEKEYAAKVIKSYRQSGSNAPISEWLKTFQC